MAPDRQQRPHIHAGTHTHLPLPIKDVLWEGEREINNNCIQKNFGVCVENECQRITIQRMSKKKSDTTLK